MAPRRSDQGARLKNTHHTRIANAPTTEPIIPKTVASGTTMGMTNLITHSRNAAATPGHSRSDFWGIGWSIWVRGMGDCTLPTRRLFQISGRDSSG
jgi:hypothetical protein